MRKYNVTYCIDFVEVDKVTVSAWTMAGAIKAAREFKNQNIFCNAFDANTMVIERNGKETVATC